jgi:tetratricopeptide (TPR) repeat protein
VKRIAGLLTVALLLSAPACRQPAAQKKIPITTSSEKARAAFLKARELMDRWHSHEARPVLDDAIREDPNFAMALLYRAQTTTSIAEYRDRMKAAVAAAPKATEPEQMFIRAAEALSNGNRKEGREILAKLVAAWPEDERAREALGMNLYLDRQYEAAVSEFRKATELNRAYAPAYNMLGYAWREAGNLKDAEAALRKYVELVPNEPNPLDSLAELLLSTGKLEESIDLYGKAVALDAKFTNAYRGTAAGLIFLDRQKEAMEQLQKMFDNAREDSERESALRAMAGCLVSEGRLKEALDPLSRLDALAASTSHGQARAGSHFLRGEILLLLQQPDQAKAAFVRAHEYLQQSAVPERYKRVNAVGHHGLLARVAAARRDFTTAREETAAMRAGMAGLAEGPELLGLHSVLGVLALTEKKYDEAIAELKQADPKSPYDMYQMGLAYAGKKDAEQAKAWYKKALTTYQLAEFLDLLVRPAARRALGS